MFSSSNTSRTNPLANMFDDPSKTVKPTGLINMFDSAAEEKVIETNSKKTTQKPKKNIKEQIKSDKDDVKPKKTKKPPNETLKDQLEAELGVKLSKEDVIQIYKQREGIMVKDTRSNHKAESKVKGK